MLDNLEHLPGVEAIVARLLARATVLATSRQPLGLQAEHRYPVAPLAERAAIRLFESRAAARGFALSEQDGPAVEELCRRLGGHPLAIELAAARLGVLDPAGLAARLEDALSLLGPGPSDAPARQRTLRATMDWSYGLLSEAERDAFTAFGAFASDCALDAAEAVTGAALPVLDALVDKSLITASGGRLAMLEPVRQYAAERLEQRPDAEAVRGRALDHYTALAERTRRELWSRGRATPVFEALHRERGNFRAVLTWAGASAAGVRLAGALDFYWWAANAEAEARTAYERALTPVPEDADPADVARARLGWARRLQPDSSAAIAQATAALEIYRALDDDAGMAHALLRLSNSHSMDADYETATTLAERAVEHARAAGDEALVGFTLTNVATSTRDVERALPLLDEGVAALRHAGAIGRIAGGVSTVAFYAIQRGEHEQARRLFSEGLEAARESRSPYLEALVRGNAGLNALLSDRLDEAREAFGEQLRIAQANALVTFYFEGLLGFAALAAHDGHPELAAALSAASTDHSDRPASASERPIYDAVDARYLAPARDALGAREWERAAARGRGLSIAEAIALRESPRR